MGKTQGFFPFFFAYDGATTEHLLLCPFFSDVLRRYFWPIIILIESRRINALSAVFVQTRINRKSHQKALPSAGNMSSNKYIKSLPSDGAIYLIHLREMKDDEKILGLQS